MPEIKALDSTIHYEDSGEGTPFVFLHGNPGSSYLWREILPRIGPGRLLAPDLIGMGRSGKPDIAYTFDDHARYLDEWFDALGLDRVVLVGHDWGGALAFDWASRHQDRVIGIAFLESIVKPMALEDLSPQARARSEKIRSSEGEHLYLDQDLFVRQAFTGGGVLTPVSERDLAVYLSPYPTRASRRPLLAWARQMPLGGEPAGLVTRIAAYDAWLAASPQVPKLMMTFEGSPTLLGAATADWCARTIAALEIVHCGAAGHHAPEDRPAEIATAVSDWADRLGLRLCKGRPLQVLAHAVAERPVGELVLVDGDEHVPRLSVRVLARQFGDPGVERLLLPVGAARPHGDVDVDEAVVAVHAQVVGVVAEHPGRPVVAGEHLEQVVVGDADRLD